MNEMWGVHVERDHFKETVDRVSSVEDIVRKCLKFSRLAVQLNHVQMFRMFM